ncbi:hypothetical protein F1B92_02940 [Campylobacter sp. FMV-PI01]|uniref:Pyridoxamine 5'-phosphate oxidase putative domain-containing protein n=1 Tax=Campylobacter portucalensis TaxID=2608384 RepID=A0A6L5WG84_9BACT|nr:hypothetical protein [Campylobacter portucalensis]MSN96160.1 hypothetical protein [Campylobacter portucalensis]
MKEKMDKFIKSMHILSLSVVNQNSTYSFSAFYAYNQKTSTFFIASSDDTTHIKALNSNDNVSGTIALQTKIIGKIQGVQFLAKMRIATQDEKKIYFKTFPYALTMNPKIWAIEISWAKFTDNRLTFGQKFIWQKS